MRDRKERHPKRRQREEKKSASEDVEVASHGGTTSLVDSLPHGAPAVPQHNNAERQFVLGKK